MILETILLSTLSILCFVYLVFGLDDLFIDLLAWSHRLFPRHLSNIELKAMEEKPQKKIAITVPAWKEGEIIDRMLLGNIQGIEYGNYDFFVGVYPNDTLTRDKVTALSQKHPQNQPMIHAVVNPVDGPTSKGQILNEVVRQIFDYEKVQGIVYDAILLQDAEDVIHPKALSLINTALENNDFVQIPVFSTEVKWNRAIAGTYMDEFAESHTKDLLVRESLGAAIPSAGVGTALSRKLLLTLWRSQNGSLLNHHSLTEDYELGIRAHALGFRSSFQSVSYQTPTARREFIATREHFPKHFSRSVRQKTRWSIGIALQGWRNIGWIGSLSNRYFLWRDRKGLFANTATLGGYVVFPAVWTLSDRASPLLNFLFQFCLVLMMNRIFQRAICTYRVYGLGGVVAVPLRWPLGVLVNALATIRALYSDTQVRWGRAKLVWDKTEHEIPATFGLFLSNGVATT